MTFSEFKIGVEIKENRLLCEIIFEKQPDCDLKYAFYLLFNGKKSDTRAYSDLNMANFQLIEDGEYQVMGFVMQDTERYINTSKSINFVFDERYPIVTPTQEDKRIPISIFGSCVSRDLFEYDRSKRLFLKTYIARQSIVSAISTPISIEKEDINLASNFQRQCVYNDFKKNTMELFRKDGSKYLLIDLIDERFKLAVYADKNGEKSLVTYSTYLQESQYIKSPKLLEKKKNIFNGKKYYINDIPLDEYLEEFCKRISSIYSEENVIIHKCRMSQFYIDKNNQIRKFDKNYLFYNKMTNELLDYMYDYLECRMPKAMIINISDEYCADENHKWGLSPMHYQKEYYIKVLHEIENYIKNFDC